MCTVTFVAQQKGYYLGMNRDEKLSRVAGLPPTKRRVNGRNVICPSEPTGGTWISLNDAGVCFALINWYSVADRVKHQPISRGEVVKIVSWTVSSSLADETLNTLDLQRFNPFRLIGIFPATNEIAEWRWNLVRIVSELRPWKTQQWISSGFDEGCAQDLRSRTFRQHLAETPKPDLHWLRALHKSHSPNPGPFSTCVHRSDAGTVSFTEVAVNSAVGVMRYVQGYPCKLSIKSRSESDVKFQVSFEPLEPALGAPVELPSFNGVVTK